MEGNTLSVQGAPAVPGLTFRGYRGPEDFPGMVAVYDACRPVDGLEMPLTVDHLARWFAHMDQCDPSRDMIVAEVGGEMVGYGRGRWFREPSGTFLHELTGHVAPAWRRRGIGRAILREYISVRRPWRRRGLARALIMRSLRILQAEGMTEAALGVDTENVTGALQLNESCGFRPERGGGVYRKPLRLA